MKIKTANKSTLLLDKRGEIFEYKRRIEEIKRN